MVNVKKGDVLEREGKRYLVIIADNEYFVLCERYEVDDGNAITVFTNPEIYCNNLELESLTELGFTYIGNVGGKEFGGD